ncbi:MAG: transcriptional regulator [Clostridiales bacterium]|nr:transcriptional regulator [Clostridiales bacterium]
MPAAKNRVGPGSRFGMLTVACDSGQRKNGYIIWKCTCDCGKELLVDKRTLERGTVRDCGCVTKVKPRQRDITGMRFGMLTAVYSTDRRAGDGDYIWHCVCDCGGEVDAPLHQLQAGYRKSCGCLSHPPLKDFVGKRFGRLTVESYAGKEKGIHQWKCRCDCGNETVVGQTHLQMGTTRSCGCLKSETLRENLKMFRGTSVTLLERNLSHLRANNTSGCTGVYQDKNSGRWVAKIGFQGKIYFLGAFRIN